jgi:hypothetical protein
MSSTTARLAQPANITFNTVSRPASIDYSGLQRTCGIF